MNIKEFYRVADDLSLISRGLMTPDGYLTPAGQDYAGEILDRLVPYVPRGERPVAQKANLLWRRVTP